MRTYFNTLNNIFCIVENPVDIWENAKHILKWDSTPFEIKQYKNGLRVWKREG